jgi:hypothetical protein
MDTRRSKLGDFILTADEFNRYEVIAKDANSFATLDEADPDANKRATLSLYHHLTETGHERRAVVLSDHVYGASRKVERVLFDLVALSSEWYYSMRADDTPRRCDMRVHLRVRAITCEFDPATIDWTWAYVTDGGNLSFAPGVAEALVAHKCFVLEPSGAPTASAYLYEDDPVETLASPLVLKREHLPEEWNEEAEIRGFEFRLGVSAVSMMAELTSFASFEADLDDPRSGCFVVRA